jgi:hypothetical protein
MKISKHLKDWNESDLFYWLSQNYYNLLVNTNEGFSRFDCYDIETKNRIELKCRKKHYDDLIIEKTKFDSLVNVSNFMGDVPVYINSTPKGIFLFYLKNIDIQWFEKSLPTTTEFYDKNKIQKKISKINIKDSIKLK